MDISSIKKATKTLEALALTDQRAIKDFRTSKITGAELSKINLDNVEIVRQVIKENGFPTIGTTSYKAYKAAVLVVLHSENAELLNQVITTIGTTDTATIEKRDLAFLIDRLRVIQGKSQLYGTQYKITSDKKIDFIEIEDVKNLEKRRAELGMESFAKYQETIKNALSNRK